MHLEKSDNGDMTIALETRKGNNLVLSDVESYFENPDDKNCDYNVLIKGKGDTELTPYQVSVISVNKDNRKLQIKQSNFQGAPFEALLQLVYFSDEKYDIVKIKVLSI